MPKKYVQKQLTDVKTYLSARGYGIAKTPTLEPLLQQLRDELTVKPFVNPNMPNANDVQPFPVYRESTTKFYMPRIYGIQRFGVPQVCKLGTGDDTPGIVFNGALREEQRLPVEAFLNAVQDPAKMGGILEMRCAAGKTVMALYIASVLKKRTLIICHKEFLMNQWRERIQQFLPTTTVGIIKQAKVDIDKDIVIASLQSLCMRDYDESIFERFGFVTIDECFPYKQWIVTENGPMYIGRLYDMWKNGEKLPLVKSFDEKTQSFAFKQITYAWKKENNTPLKEIWFGNGNIKCTPNHRILTTNGWKNACEIVNGDLIMASTNIVACTKVQDVPNNDSIDNKHVYDIEVEDFHTFVCATSTSTNGVVVHNCHHTGAEVFSRAFFKICSPAILGLSATVKRKDGLSKVFEWYIGKPVYTLRKRDDPEVTVIPIMYSNNSKYYGKEIQMFNGKLNIAAMITAVTSFGPRNERIVEEWRKLHSKEPHRKLLILSERRAHLDTLKEWFDRMGNVGTTGYYVGGMSEAALKASESAQIILATFAMAAEGMDIPALDTLILASPVSAIEQPVGRILRQKPEDRKHIPTIVDVIDDFSMFAGQGRKRLAFYKKQGYAIQGTETCAEAFRETQTALENVCLIRNVDE